MTQNKDLIALHNNTHRSRSLSVALLQDLTTAQTAYRVGIRYIPDKLLLDPENLPAYLEKILSQTDVTVDLLAPEIIEDLMDQVIPKWIEVTLEQAPDQQNQKIIVTVEDRQPNWQDDGLLLRLPRLFP
ncbi:hypothetical protein [Paremcibacter congregatus]|uniref:Uncharacterized protein n=1 Tax=Paremcibacter congregatus TaxID=2043170 RepID=A0A2G4YSD2_9PROT|nr:hypothetical protein [Paremcibacter congregatus]PHZ85252.1 hypothetical protein CRD36_07550 [Paremcibacter congregatus]QDE27816.1 hypothetical protein FIV45_11285 [Paremcibacter congregatus]